MATRHIGYLRTRKTEKEQTRTHVCTYTYLRKPWPHGWIDGWIDGGMASLVYNCGGIHYIAQLRSKRGRKISAKDILHSI